MPSGASVVRCVSMPLLTELEWAGSGRRAINMAFLAELKKEAPELALRGFVKEKFFTS